MATSLMLVGIILAGGKGKRLGGASKADLDVGGRLLDRVIDAMDSYVITSVVTAPDSVDVPPHVHRTMEDPPGGGPLAGIAAAVDVYERFGYTQGWALVWSVDSPGIHEIIPGLIEQGERNPQADGVIVRGGDPPYDQYLQAVYSLPSLRQALREAEAERGTLSGVGVTRVLRHLNLRRLPVPAGLCRDIDTAEDLEWWRGHISDEGQ